MKNIVTVICGLSLCFAGINMQADATDYLDLGVQAYTFGKTFEKKAGAAQTKLAVVVKSFAIAKDKLNALKAESEKPGITASQKEQIMAQMLAEMVAPLKDFDAFLTSMGGDIITPALAILEAVPLPELQSKLKFKSGKTFSEYTKENLEFFDLMIKVLSKNLPQISSTLKTQAMITQAVNASKTPAELSKAVKAAVQKSEQETVVDLSDL